MKFAHLTETCLRAIFQGGGGLGAIYHTYYTFVTLETSRKLGRVQLRDRRARP